jgi:hypothetical protein
VNGEAGLNWNRLVLNRTQRADIGEIFVVALVRFAIAKLFGAR